VNVTPRGRLGVYGAALVASAVMCACGSDEKVSTPTASVTPAGVAPSQLLDSLLKRADAFYNRNNDTAQVLWGEALAHADSIHDSVSIARALTGLSQIARLRLESVDSRRMGEQALAIKLQLGMRSELFRSYNTLGLLAWDEGRLTDAFDLYEKASVAAAAVGDSAGLAKAQINIGLGLKDVGDFDAARAALVRGRDGARAAHDTKNLGRALTNVAALDITVGDPLSALATLEAARTLYSTIADSLGIANALGQAATAYDALGEPQRAFAALDSALRIARSQSLRKEEAEDLKILADLYARAGDHQRALDHYRTAAAIADTSGDPEERGNLLRNAARSRFALGRTDLAEQLAVQALAIHRAGSYRDAEIGDRILLAELAQERGNPADAESHVRAARMLAAELGVGVERARVAVADARIASLSGDAPRVIRALDAARPEIATSGESMVAEAAALRLGAYARLGQLDAAAAAGRQAVAAIERVRGNYGSGELRVSFASDRAGVYADLVVVLLRLGRTSEAFEVADLAHGRALLDHIASARAEVERSGQSGRAVLEADQLLRKIDLLLKKLRDLEQSAPRERAPHAVATTRDLADRVAEARSQYEALVARVPESERSMALLGAGTRSAAAVQASLDPGEVMLEYLVTPGRLIVFIVTRTAISSLASDVTRDDLLQRTRLVRDLMAQSHPDGREQPMLEALYDALIRPVAATGVLRDAHRLIIVRHSALTYLPFAALSNRETRRYLVEDLPLLYVPSAASLAALRTLGDGNARTSGAAPEAFAPFPQRLPGTVTEAKSFVGSVSGARSVVGGSATEGRVREALRAGAAVHVATHAVMNARNPLFSRIELAPLPGGGAEDNGRLEVHELLDLRIASPLVFLSGCETGVGDAWSNAFIVGDDYTTLAQSLLFAGAANVVATLWRIDDEAAATLAAHFYERARSVSAPEALAFAQQAMLRDPSRRGPYFWASYEVTGGERPHHVLQFSR